MDASILQPHELTEHGFEIVPSGKEPSNMVFERQTPGQGEYYTPTEEVNMTLPDGRIVLVAAAGVPIPYWQAVSLGLIEPPPPPTPVQQPKEKPQPQETKPATGPSETKPASRPSEKKKADVKKGTK